MEGVGDFVGGQYGVDWEVVVQCFGVGQNIWGYVVVYIGEQ